MPSGLDLAGEFRQEVVHDVSVESIKQKRELLPCFRVYGPDDVGTFEAILPRSLLSDAFDRPEAVADPLLAESGFVLVPDLETAVLFPFLIDEALGFFFQSSMTSGSFFGF